MTPPMTPREKVEPCYECGSTERIGTACAPCNPDLTALAPGSGDHAGLARAIERLLPIGIHETPDYAEVSFGECQAQAMTMEPETWLALNQLPALLAENAALRAERDRIAEELHGEINYAAEQSVRATEAERKLAEAVEVIRDVDRAARQAASMNDAGYTVTVERTATHIYGITDAFLFSKEAERG